jgi:hypothetical protein
MANNSVFESHTTDGSFSYHPVDPTATHGPAGFTARGQPVLGDTALAAP